MSNPYQRSTLKLFSDDTASAKTVVLESKINATEFTSIQPLTFNNNVTVLSNNVLTAFDISGSSHNVGQKLTTTATAIETEVTDRAFEDSLLLGTTDDKFSDVTIRGVKAGVVTNIANITANSSNIVINASSISSNTSLIGTNATAIATETYDRGVAVSDEATLRSNGDATLLGATNDALTANTIFGCKEAIQDTNANVTSNDVDIAANLASINTNTSNIASNDNDIAANTASIDELKGDLATILDGSSINFSDLSDAVETYATANTTTGVLDILNNLAARCTHLEGVLDELLNNELGHSVPLNNMPINNIPSNP